MQVKEIDINTGKIKRYGICKKKVQNLIFRWSYHSDLLYKGLIRNRRQGQSTSPNQNTSLLADTGKARGCSPNSLAINSFIH